MTTQQHLLCCALAIMMSSTGWTRIGETLEECKARYGEPTFGPDVLITWRGENHAFLQEIKGAQICRFDKESLVIQAVFFGGTAQMLSFQRANGEDMASYELDTILEKNLDQPSKATIENGPIVQAINQSKGVMNLLHPSGMFAVYFRGKNRVSGYLDNTLDSSRPMYYAFFVSDDFLKVLRVAYDAYVSRRQAENLEEIKAQKSKLDGL
jgi:hypothetical protein